MREALAALIFILPGIALCLIGSRLHKKVHEVNVGRVGNKDVIEYQRNAWGGCLCSIGMAFIAVGVLLWVLWVFFPD